MSAPPPVVSNRPVGSVLRSMAGAGVLLLIGFAIAYAVSEAVAPMYPAVRAREAVLDRVAPGVEAAVFGGSHSYAVRFSELGVRGFYFGLTGADLFECRRLLQHARRRLPNLREVYLVVSPYQIDNGDVPSRYGRRRTVYVQTGTHRPISNDWRVALTTPLIPVIRDDHWRGLFRSQEPIVVLPNGIIVGGIMGDGDLDPVAMDSMAVEGYRRAKFHSSGVRQLLRLDPTLCERTDEALRAFVDDAGPDLQVVLFTPPYHPSYLTQPRPCDPLHAARALAAERPNVVYFDHSRSALAGRTELFQNPDHLNTEGKELFTTALRRELAAAGVFDYSSDERTAN